MRSRHPVERPTLYHFPPSLCSQKVRLALREKGVAFDERLVNIGPRMENYEAWYARINPRMVVPTLEVGGEYWTDSASIVRRIDETFDGPDLGVGTPEVEDLIRRQDGLQIREIAYSKTTGLVAVLAKGSFEKRLSVLAQRREENPDLAQRYQERIDDVRRWKAVSTTPEQAAAAREKLDRTLATLEDAVGTNQFLAGERYTLADVTWTVILARMRFMKVPLGGHLRAYYARMKARPSFRSADIWERAKPLRLAPIIAGVVAHRLGLG